MLEKLFHHTKVNLPPSHIVSPSSPYLAAKTQNHKEPFSSLNHLHHLRKRDKLNSLILLNLIPPSSCLRKIVSQFIQDIFLESSFKQESDTLTPTCMLLWKLTLSLEVTSKSRSKAFKERIFAQLLFPKKRVPSTNSRWEIQTLSFLKVRKIHKKGDWIL